MLAAAAAAELGLPPAEQRLVHRAGLVAGLGRLGVSNAIWDKPGPLSAAEWERARLYPHYTERMLHRSRALAPAGRLAGQVAERLDGSGYPGGLPGAALSLTSRVVATAGAVPDQARGPTAPAGAVRRRGHHGSSGTTSGPAAWTATVVDAVLRAAGERVPRRGRPGRTHRQGDRGAAVPGARPVEPEIAKTLVISPKTVGNHVEHVYTKIGVKTVRGRPVRDAPRARPGYRPGRVLGESPDQQSVGTPAVSSWRARR